MLTEWDRIFTVFRFSGGPGNRNPLRKTWRYLINNKFQSQLKFSHHNLEIVKKDRQFKCISSKIWQTLIDDLQTTIQTWKSM